HAGAVAHRGRIALLPGQSFAGKTTLTAALVELGALYYSDEFAVLDADGLVHPYAKDLSIRDHGRMQRSDTPVETLGGLAGRVPRGGPAWTSGLEAKDGTVVAAAAVIVAGLLGGAGLSYVLRRLRRGRPDLAIGAPLAAGLAIRWLAIAGVSALGLNAS